MFPTITSRFALAAGAALALTLAACGGGGNDASGSAGTPDGGSGSGGSGTSGGPPSPLATTLQGVVYGTATTAVPSGAKIPITMMGQMRALFDLIKAQPDFTQVKMDMGSARWIHPLATNTGDQFIPGKLALGLSWILIDMKAKHDPQYAAYLATYQTVTTALMTSLNGGNYRYANTSWGEYYFLVALNNLQAHGMLNEVFSDAMLATLRQRLQFCDMFGADASGATSTCPAAGTPIDIASLNTSWNGYAVAYGIAGLRQKLGWSNPTFSSATDPTVATMSARDALLYTLTNHLRNDASGGFSDEASDTHTTYYDQARFDRYSALLIAEVTESTLEMGNEANLTPELKGYLRKSVDLILPQLNLDGQGFNYGRSIGPSGDTAFMEVLTAAANVGVLTDAEKQAAYAFIYHAALRFENFWYDPALPTPSVNMWVKGRGTDVDRDITHVMGENFSLLHQYLYVNAWWNQLGFGGTTPLTDTAFQAWLDSTQPHVKLTWYNLPTDTAHPYVAALVTVRDGKRVFNLNLSQAPDYNPFTPYYPVPFSDRLIYGTANATYALLIPQILYNNKTYQPVTYYRNLNVQEANGQVVVSFDTTKFRLATKNPLASTDIDLQTHTVLTFSHGQVSRTDTLSSATLTGDILVTTSYAGFALITNSTANPDGASASYIGTAATGYATTGFDSCGVSSFGSLPGTPYPPSATPIGALNSSYTCTTGFFPLGSGVTRTLGWTLKYTDPA
ncbi:hypothetical protein [Burkholderia plantarii]|uniref:Lipoprotein n=2 Tax=Burkholderia plantarii TaxID=41899 RepID=A0A0B6RZK1_BURPL|nr:hypothetical protein [Burkholderia plantarii]AJK46505.1 hypothetical protein BGL_1c19960 [Burkholderia plantarii]